MHRQMYLVVELVCLIFASANAALLPTAKCDNRSFTAVKVPIQQLFTAARWNLLYLTNAPELSTTDHVFTIYSNNKSGEYYKYSEIVMNNGSRLPFTGIFSDGYSNEYYVNKCWDGNGNVNIFRYYLLYFIEGKVVYFYQCNGSDVPGVYISAPVRYIAVAGNYRLTDREKQKIFALDCSLFGGGLRELPWKLP